MNLYNNNNNNTRSSIACLTYMSRHALQMHSGYGTKLNKCVLSSFLNRLRSEVSRSVEGRAFHARWPE